MKSNYKLVALFSTILFFSFLVADFTSGVQTGFSVFMKLAALAGVLYGMVQASIEKHKPVVVVAQAPAAPQPVVVVAPVAPAPQSVVVQAPVMVEQMLPQQPLVEPIVVTPQPTAERVEPIVVQEKVEVQQVTPQKIEQKIEVVIQAPKAEVPKPTPASEPAPVKAEVVKEVIKEVIKAEAPKAPEPPKTNLVEVMRALLTPGMNISDILKLAEQYYPEVNLKQVNELLSSESDEQKTLALWLLINRFKKASPGAKREIFNFYITHRKHVNNWNLVDLGARNIVGEYLLTDSKEEEVIKKFADNESVWDRRTLVMSTHPFIAQSKHEYVFSVMELLIADQEDLIQSSIGWVLKELYKQDANQALNFIQQNFSKLSKQAIRIGTERMAKEERKPYLRGEIPLTQSMMTSIV